MILQQKLGVGFETYDKYLLNNRALAVQLPHPGPDEAGTGHHQYRARGRMVLARPALFPRSGPAMCFPATTSGPIEEAIDELFSFPWAIKRKMRNRGRSWHARRPHREGPGRRIASPSDCQSGFIEPLESTAIFMVDMALQWLTNYFPDKSYNPVMQKRFNDRMARPELRNSRFHRAALLHREHAAGHRHTGKPHATSMQVPDAAAGRSWKYSATSCRARRKWNAATCSAT